MTLPTEREKGLMLGAIVDCMAGLTGLRPPAESEQIPLEYRPHIDRLMFEMWRIAQAAHSNVEPATDNVGATDRWQDPRDLSGGETDCAPPEALPIPTSERLPEYQQNVLLWLVTVDPKNSGWVLGQRSSHEEGKFWDGERYRPMQWITHWKPLPAAPSIPFPLARTSGKTVRPIEEGDPFSTPGTYEPNSGKKE